MVNASTGVTNLNCWLDYTPRGILLSTHAGNQGGSENTQPESVDTAPLLSIRRKRSPLWSRSSDDTPYFSMALVTSLVLYI